MKDPVDFYFDFSSPYGYFASTRIDNLAGMYGRKVNWHPVLLGAVFKKTGAAPLPMVPLKGDYARRDFERTARFHRIEFREPSPFPISTQVPARAMRWIAGTQGDARAVEFAKAVYRAYFVDGVNIGEQANVAEIAGKLGIDAGALVDAINGDAIKEQLKAEVEQAMARGVFGSPYVVVDGEPFWGFDRFDQLEAFLRNGKI
jgi:2-hydroxychromene-2-carboxylate isomerase